MKQQQRVTVLFNEGFGGRAILRTLFFSLVVCLGGVQFTSGEPARNSGNADAGALVSLSRDIFLGRVVQKVSFVGSGGDIMTRYVFQVQDTLKGRPSDVFEMIEYGGTVGDLTMVVSHGARYEEGSEYLVFAWMDDFGRARTLGGDQGGLAVIEDRGGERFVRLGMDHPLRTMIGNRGTFLTAYRQIADQLATTSGRRAANK